MFFVYPQTQLTISAYDFLKCKFLGSMWIPGSFSIDWAKVALRLVQKLGRDKQSKMCLKFAVFLPLLPSIYIFQIFYFLEM